MKKDNHLNFKIFGFLLFFSLTFFFGTEKMHAASTCTKTIDGGKCSFDSECCSGKCTITDPDHDIGKCAATKVDPEYIEEGKSCVPEKSVISGKYIPCRPPSVCQKVDIHAPEDIAYKCTVPKVKSTTTPTATPTTTGASQMVDGGSVFTNPLQFYSVEGFLMNLLSVLRQIIVVLSLVFVVIGAVMYTISAGGSMVETAKKTITSALIGLAIGIAAPSFLKEISIVLGWTGETSPDVVAAPTLTDISLNVLNFLLASVGILSVIMLVVGGVMYLSSAGSEDRIDQGKKIVTNAIIGIIISLSAMVLVRQIALFFVG